ncbi:Putative Holin-X, holin superfamily III [Pedobacter steynii]|jgi:DMSO/TMAO reductase YedYZ heme-binding membrane subunit|uniref:Putative Holin-X, holin superfamily III n=1 Tax=Pedobacter steynii TaxID=430522 RepID=A0A1H0DV50_9SPHI|nr:phage holin family protein [Pedobacter steynii]NQX41843.1 phage holin family protein [Pedobacter steynii]SDN73939.1 Putative Holin-X, holin superfamily III [Pedobacter steynii]
MQENKEKDLEDLVEDAKGYVNTRLEYTRLYLVERGSKMFADMVTNATVAICFLLAFLFGTFTLALFLSDVLGSYTRGFGCVALIYILLAMIVYFMKEKYIEKAIINFTIRRYFNKLADKEEEDEQKV